MKIYLASDHAGFDLKQFLGTHLKDLGHEVEDCGALEIDPLDDYPDFIIPLAKLVSNNPKSRGIIIGGSGQGEAMAANRIQGVRAAVYYDGPINIVKLSRSHNDSNVISFGARFITHEKAVEVLNVWLKEPFEGGRHSNRIKKLDI